VQAYTWTAIFMPKDTPAPIVAKLQKATSEAMESPGLRDELQTLSAVLVAPERRSSVYLGQFVKSELVKWGNAMKAGGVIPK
jgi:tripartite-type tricarboxylate transporter receptor subunit TctC